MKLNKESELFEDAWEFTIPQFLVRPPFHLLKYSLSTYLFILVVAGFLVNQFLLAKVNSSTKASNTQQTPIASSVPTLSAFDQSMIAKLKNEGKPIPILGTAHNHADMKVFVNGQSINFAKPEYYMKSKLIHVDNNQNQEDASSVLHMHAKGVPMGWFFESLGMKLEKESFTAADGQIYKNENGKTLKFYLNGQKVDDLGDYSFQPLDKLLISYGSETDTDVQKQINSVTNYAKDHQK